MTKFPRFALAAAMTACAVAVTAQAPVQHPIATAGAAAQSAFDRGLALTYAFNFAAAERAFRRASALDPRAPMPYWGLAFAEGPNLNARQPSLGAERAASDALARARESAAALPASAEAAEEQAYIAALALRISCAPHPAYGSLEAAYSDAMRALSARYPDDPDAATLYAESLMELRGWRRWVSPEGIPVSPSAEQILATLQGVLRRWPDHLGANHLYIHAAENARRPALALASAHRLERIGANLPGDGHLLHMPAHVFLHTGAFAEAERAGLAAAAADRAYIRAHPKETAYFQTYGVHNLLFITYAAEMDGDFKAAYSASEQAEGGAGARATGVAFPAAMPIVVLARFGRWHDVLAAAGPAPSGAHALFWWHFARASALAATGDTHSAVAELRAMRTTAWPPSAQDPHTPYRPLPSSDVAIANQLVAARIAEANGRPSDAIQDLTQAVALQSRLPPGDPPAWYPVSETLAAVLLRAGRPARAAEVLQHSLARVPGDPRAEFELARAWHMLAREQAAAAATASFHSHWRGGPLRLGVF